MTKPIQSSPASRNPADNDSLTGLLRVFKTKLLQNIDDMLPAQVIGYDRKTNLASVQPLIAMVTTDSQLVARGQVQSVPVYQISAGAFVVSFPVAAGDLGWIKANDSDISLFKQTFAAAAPNTARLHSFKDALFFPQAAWNLIELADEDIANGNLVIQSFIGTCKIAVWQNLIKILAPQGVGIGGTPNPSAILDLQSTTQAFILPRMTTTEKNAIKSPIDGMQVYDTTEMAVSLYSNGAWS